MNEQQNDAIPLPPPASDVLLSLQRHASNNAGMPTSQSTNNNPNNVPQNLFANPSIQPSSVINLSNSSEVVIGPMTQYQGSVTIYQYMDATVQARATHANGGINQNRTKHETNVIQNTIFQNKTFLITLLLIVVIIIVGVTVYLLLSKNQDKSLTRQEILFGNNYEYGTFPNLGNGHLIIDREQWGAQTVNASFPKLEHPIPYVLITHIGVQSSPCYNVYKCSIKMRTIQDSSIAEQKLLDVKSNFYVGNDGNVYVGRGWYVANSYANKSLAVCFLGDYIRNEPSEKQLEAVQYLLAYGITNKHLALDYKLVAQNQTKSTRSPGANVYKTIVKWPHWTPCGMNNYPKCGVEIGLPEVWDAKQ